MKMRELMNLGIPRGPVAKIAMRACADSALSKPELRERIAQVVAEPKAWSRDVVFGELARALDPENRDRPAPLERVGGPAPIAMWGEPGEDFDHQSVEQMNNAARVPVAVAGALMPDAHLGYGLPIGGVLATENAVIPYAVGVDIACRVKLTVLDLPADELNNDAGRERLTRAIETETRFGMGAAFGARNDLTKPREHSVMDEDWSVSPVTDRFKDKAHKQLGTSGSGNHFVEFGVLTLDDEDHARSLGLACGKHLALLSHSGSRGTGASVCDHYSKLAMRIRSDLPKQLQHLAWLDLDSQEGREYWDAMNLMGRYAAANHACIHHHIAKHLGAQVLADIENHHNFAWKERHDFGDGRGEREVIVHRKGATPAGTGAMGIIPGSMADPCYVVRGLGGAGSIDSASHGAGRVMSRRKAKETFRWSGIKPLLKARNVTLLSAGIDENPNVYKDIRRVMALQRDLVEPLARFDPRLVKMAPDGERAED